MKILVACEESQRVCKAFRDKGHEAFSVVSQYQPNRLVLATPRPSAKQLIYSMKPVKGVKQNESS